MARDNIAFLVNLRKNENTESKGYGRPDCPRHHELHRPRANHALSERKITAEN